MGIAPTLLASDNKGPVMVIEQRKGKSMNIGKQDLTLEVKVNTDGFLEKAQAVADARRALDEALDNLENHIITHTAAKPAKAESVKIDIYREDYFPTPERELFAAVEKALGFKLFFWQKIFILRGEFRQYGATTARILRDLIGPSLAPIEFINPPQNQREVFYRHQLRKIQVRLIECGISTNPVFWSHKDRMEYYAAGKENNQ